MTAAAPQTDLFCTPIGSCHYQRDHLESNLPPTKNLSGSDAKAKLWCHHQFKSLPSNESQLVFESCQDDSILVPNCITSRMHTPVRSKSLRSPLFPRNPNVHLPDLETFQINRNVREWITSNIRKYFLTSPGQLRTVAQSSLAEFVITRMNQMLWGGYILRNWWNKVECIWPNGV